MKMEEAMADKTQSLRRREDGAMRHPRPAPVAARPPGQASSERSPVKSSLRAGALVWALAAATFLLGGCKAVGDWLKVDSSRFMAPEEVVKQPTGSPVNPILTGISPIDRTQELLPNAVFPDESDWQYTEKDYVIGPTDVVDISVMDLMAEGLETVLRREVSNTGYIDLPLLERRIRAEGLTARGLEKAIADAYSPNILRNPTVSVTVAARRNSSFSIIGAVATPGTYGLVRLDTRLLDALALAGGVTQLKIKYIYVIRQRPPVRLAEEAAAARATAPVELPPLPPELPPETATKPAATQPPGQDANAALRELQKALPGGAAAPPAPAEVRLSEAGPPGPAATPSSRPAALPAPPAERWVYSAGKWVRVSEAASKPAATASAPAPQTAADLFGWKKFDGAGASRVVAVNLDQLRNGDPRMNIVMRNGDVINVPSLDVGEFYVMGEVARPGVYSLTGRQITLKQAVAAAGNMGPLAWPENTILIRRVGDSQEQVVPINLEGVFRGEEPDVYLKPDDVIAVGSDIRSSFLLVLRNAFRMTYGFGFIYDRNFAELNPNIAGTSRRFTRW